MQKILIVDDESGYRNITQKLLQKQGYEVVTAESGEEATKISQCFHADVLVVDWMLKGQMNGGEVEKSIRDTNPNLATVFITGYPTEMLKKQSEIPPGSAFLEKPFDFDELQQAIHKVLKASQHSSL